ncbi:MAG TPA: hypothetical protein VK790_10280 [Solirubrobacteraceae bacterium]|nr:hypothetical protein [Solirubrobacteraceae bacterium]
MSTFWGNAREAPNTPWLALTPPHRRLHPIAAAALTTEQSTYLLAFAQALTGLLAITAAVLVFLADRTVQRARAKDPGYKRVSWLTIGFSWATIALGALSWSTWDQATPSGVSLLIGWSSKVWIGLIFGGTCLVATAISVTAVGALVKLHSAAADWQA